MATIGTGGISTTSKNVYIPIQNAGIGDVIVIQNGTDGSSLSHFKAIAGISVQATAPSGYTWYGTVYGREKRGLMIRSFSPSDLKWASTTAGGVSVSLNSSSHANVINTTTSSWGTARNGLSGAYYTMSVAECMSRNSSNNNSNLHPNTGYASYGTPPMGLANFNADTSGAKTLYGTYANYIAQALPITKGVQAGPFQFRCGKLNTEQLASANSTDGYSFPAAAYCYAFKIASEAANHWWLPDMYELLLMMSDNSFANCQYAHSVIGGNTARAAGRWSSVRSGSTAAWLYDGYGVSNNYYFYIGLTVCPVTLLPL
jgi:hypothetical protein